MAGPCAVGYAESRACAGGPRAASCVLILDDVSMIIYTLTYFDMRSSS